MAKIILDAGSGVDVPDELYDMLLEAFYVKAKQMGLNPFAPSVLLDDWKIECELKAIE